jgi:hypothetical protein
MFKKLFPIKKPLIGMIHLLPLPGYPTHPGMDEVIRKALNDLKSLEQAGFDGALVENDNDQPHYIIVPDEVSLAFKQVMKKLVKNTSLPVGMEIIYDMKATLEVAKESNAAFVRFDVFVDSVKTKWGIIQAQADELMGIKKQLGAKNIVVLVDVQVKHATLVEKKPLVQSVLDSIHAGADGLIVTGNWTGQPPMYEDCLQIKKVAGDVPVLIGSGLTDQNAERLLSFVDGAIVGTSIKTGEYVDVQKAKKLLLVVKKVRNSL